MALERNVAKCEGMVDGSQDGWMAGWLDGWMVGWLNGCGGYGDEVMSWP